ANGRALLPVRGQARDRVSGGDHARQSAGRGEQQGNRLRPATVKKWKNVKASRWNRWRNGRVSLFRKSGHRFSAENAAKQESRPDSDQTSSESGLAARIAG